MASRFFAWTLHLESERIQRMNAPQNRWWSGEGTLAFETHNWLGARYRDGGMLMDISAARYTEALPGRRTTARLAVTSESARALLSVDLGAIDLTIGWIWRTPFGGWSRIPRYFTGRVGASVLKDGVFEVEIETYLGDIDRGIPEYWSHETAQEGDLYAEQARELSEGSPSRWPPFSS